MKNVNGEYYVQVKDKRYIIRPNENNILRKRDPPTSLGTQYQVQNETEVRKNKKVVQKSGRLEVKNYPKKKKPIIWRPKFKPPKCPSCKTISGENSNMVIYVKLQNVISTKTSNRLKKFRHELIFQLYCHMLIKKLKKFIILWLTLRTIQPVKWLIICNSRKKTKLKF